MVGTGTAGAGVGIAAAVAALAVAVAAAEEAAAKQLITVDGGGHEWPAFATQRLWDFFAAHHG
jgi:polyhydroxybutyrate depolymerase